MGWMADEGGLERRTANHVPLTPLSHLARAARVFARREAVAYFEHRVTYAEYAARVSRLTSALAARGIAPGDVVSTLLPNVPAQLEAHFGVPACGAVLNAINTRLDAGTIGYILGHGGAKLVLCDTACLPVLEAALADLPARPQVIEVPDPFAGHTQTGRYVTYDELLAEGDPAFRWIMPEDEWESLALNYTSGTTGQPKGVVYSHRGAYLMSVVTPIPWRMVLHPRLLTIVPMFHCNGWCHGWMLPVMGGTAVCCREPIAAAIFGAIEREGVTHFGAAPIILASLVNAPDAVRRPLPRTVEVFTAGAPPAAATLEAMEAMGFSITHVYGLTETYGHVTECLWDQDWDALPAAERAGVKARQGVAMPMMEEVTVLDAAGTEVPDDGVTQGEIVMCGNTVMKGYYKDPAATKAALAGGVFRSGDLAVRHPGGWIEIRDRAKDIIISGGENVSSVEVEGALMRHPAVALAAVVAKPDARWGEVPCAFIELKDGAEASGGRDHRPLPRAPRRFQDAQGSGVRAPAQNFDWQDPEVRVARAGSEALNA